MATQITVPTPRTGPAPRLGGVELAILAAVAVAVIGVGVLSQAGPIRRDTIGSQAYGVGYPLHGGLAGPSSVGRVATVAGPSGSVSAEDLNGHYGAGYPVHGGLAGPSRTMPAVDLDGHYGVGYPLSGGLAGPSRAADGD